MLAENQSIDDQQSGTTAITMYLEGLDVLISNVGDSRAFGRRARERSQSHISIVCPRFEKIHVRLSLRKRERERERVCVFVSFSSRARVSALDLVRERERERGVAFGVLLKDFTSCLSLTPKRMHAGLCGVRQHSDREIALHGPDAVPPRRAGTSQEVRCASSPTRRFFPHKFRKRAVRLSLSLCLCVCVCVCV